MAKTNIGQHTTHPHLPTPTHKYMGNMWVSLGWCSDWCSSSRVVEWLGRAARHAAHKQLAAGTVHLGDVCDLHRLAIHLHRTHMHLFHWHALWLCIMGVWILATTGHDLYNKHIPLCCCWFEVQQPEVVLPCPVSWAVFVSRSNMQLRSTNEHTPCPAAGWG